MLRVVMVAEGVPSAWVVMVVEAGTMPGLGDTIVEWSTLI